MAPSFSMQSQPTTDSSSTAVASPTTTNSPKSKTTTKTTAKSPLAQNITRDFDPSERPGKRARLELESPMTAAAAMAPQPRPRQRETPPSTQTSPNPGMQVLNSLAGNAGTSKASPTTKQASTATNSATVLSEPMVIVAENIQQPDELPSESHAKTSPVSLSSLGTVDSVAPPSVVATSTIDSPSPMDESRQEPEAQAMSSTSPEEGPKAFSYPGLLPHLNEARRHNSLPNAGRQGTRSPSTKKHRCPYCATEFTRHHNLKSHLLTHSQEKPYVCSTCQSRFRRLHDLKRHTKLHTGERPHICPKCGRKFARGDALARHNKGPGGCAGRRASMGGYGSDGEYDDNDDSMEGMMYNEPENMEDEEGNDRRPGIRRHGAADGSTSAPQDDYSRQPSTYPPIQGRPPGGIASGNFPPRAAFAGPASSSSQMPPGSQAGSGPAVSLSSSSLYPPGQGPPVIAQNPMTESPKPLSPGSVHTRQLSQGGSSSLNQDRSPSMTAHYQQSQFSRSSDGRTPPAGSLSLPPGAPQLPPPHSLQPPEARYTLPSQGGPTHPPTQPSGPPTDMRGSGPLSSQSNSLSSHGHSAKGSGENSNAAFGKEDRIWSYVQSLEQGLNALKNEVDSLKGQLAAATAQLAATAQQASMR